MAKWSPQNVLVTQLGREALSKVQLGIGSLTITKIVSSKGYVPESSLYVQTGVHTISQQLAISSFTTTPDGSVINIQLTNSGLAEGYSLYQLGVYATHPDIPGEFLYVIAQCDIESPDVIPSPLENPLTMTFSLFIEHSGTDSVNITVDPAGMVTYSEFESYTIMIGEIIDKKAEVIVTTTKPVGNNMWFQLL